MSRRLDEFRVLETLEVAGPRHFHLRALYESALVIGVHLCPDASQFVDEDAREDLQTWLSTLEQTARVAGVGRPVVACLEVSDADRRKAIGRWEGEARRRGSGHVLYIESSQKDAEERLERLLFRTVDDALMRSVDLTISAEAQIVKTMDEGLSVGARSLLIQLKELLERRTDGGSSRPLKADVDDVERAWEAGSPVQVGAGATDKSLEPRASDALPLQRPFFERLREVRLFNFRGWCGPKGHNLDVNADLVLLAGPNGHGKSTLLQAVMLALTGYTPHENDALRPRRTGNKEPGPPTIHIEAREGDPLGFKLPVEDLKDGDQQALSAASIPFPNLRRSSLWHDFYRALKEAKDASAAEMNLSAVFSDRLHLRFDLKNSVDTLVSAFSAGGLQLQAISDVLHGASERLNQEIQMRSARIDRLHDMERDAKTQEEVISAFEKARTGYEILAELHAFYEQGEALPSWTALTGSNAERLEQVDRTLDMIVRVLGVDRDAVSDAIKRFVKSWMSRELNQATGKLHETIERLEAEREELLRRYPDAHESIEPFVDAEGGPPLDVCLDSLARNLQRWHRASMRAGLIEVTQQLGRVIPEDLQRLSDLMSAHLTDRRASAVRIARIGMEIDAQRQQITRSERYQRLVALEDSEALRELWRALHDRRRFEAELEEARQLAVQNSRAQQASTGLQEVMDRLEKRSVDPALRSAFTEVLNDILGRIQLSPGLWPAKIEGNGKILMADGRVLDDLSTGQKAQLAVALSAGINLALGSQLRTGVIALDDVSAAYDTSNIAREATLWRVVAYGHLARREARDEQKRQLFLSSHNEVTTRWLIELLQPPAGATMKVVRFLGWTPEHGPEYRVDEVQCTAGSNPASRERLAREISLNLRRYP